jgi:threonine dehydratase
MIPESWFLDARETITPYINITPLTYDEKQDIFIKWENHQVTGSFKARGALNKVLHLEKWEQQAGLIAASAGNHGQGVALAGKIIGVPATIYLPEYTPEIKIQAMKSFGAQVVLIPGNGYYDAERAALEAVSNSAAAWISPYNDGRIIAGQGTIAIEILDQLDAYPSTQRTEPTWLIPTSGGGLLSGIAIVVKRRQPETKIFGVQTDTSPFMHALFEGKSQASIIEQPTIAEGLAGPVENGSITVPIIRQYVDDIILVTEEAIAYGVAYAWHHYGERIEASAAVVLAAVLTEKITYRPLVLVVSGGNIQESLFQSIVNSISL